MGLRDRVAADQHENGRKHAVDKFLDTLLNPEEKAEVLEVLHDFNLHAPAVSRAIQSEYSIRLSAERIREWRREHELQG